MKIKNTLKKAYLKLPSGVVSNLYKIYDFLLYKKNRKQVINKDGNQSETIYVIRPREGSIEGLMSLLLNVVRQLRYSDKQGYIPVFDFKNFKTQYSNDDENIWENYFEQYKYTLDEITDKNVILSGLSPTRTDFINFDNWTKENEIKESRMLISKYVHINENVKQAVIKELENIDLENTVGLYIRGTDYTKLKPAGHPVQPTYEEVFIKTDEIIEKYKAKKAFLVTEDQNAYDASLKHYGDKLIVASFDSYIKNYDGKGFLSDSNVLNELSNNNYDRGFNYLVKIIILSKLNYLVAGNTCGSWAAMSFSKGYKDYYIFNLGKY